MDKKGIAGGTFYHVIEIMRLPIADFVVSTMYYAFICVCDDRLYHQRFNVVSVDKQRLSHPSTHPANS